MAADKSHDEHMNAVLATGALYAALGMFAAAGGSVTVSLILNGDGQPTNRLSLRFPFLRSPYVVTVERDRADDDASADGGAR